VARNADGPVFGRVARSVIWSNAVDADGTLLMPLDPERLAAQINGQPYQLLLGHDPGRPLGKALAAKVFTNSSGDVFVAAVLGFYENATTLRFGDFGFDVAIDAAPPTRLPKLPDDLRFTLAADPREIDIASLLEIAREAPIPIDVHERSDNAAGASHTLVVASVMFVTLVWNPFVTTFANEASKDAYAAVRSWLRKLSARLADRGNPVLELQSFHGGCAVSFILRGKDVAHHYRAHDALDGAASRAAHLIAQMRATDLAPVRLVYEFHPTDELWYPSYAELDDGRLVSDNIALIAAERLPSRLSLGLRLTGSNGSEESSA